MATLPTREQLINSIQFAFAGTPHPGADHITRAGCCAECDELAAWYGVRTWQEARAELYASIAHNDVDHSPSMLFVPEAFHYFIPAFLLHSIDPFDPTDADRLYACVYPLVPIAENDPNQIERFKQEKLPLFNRQQRSVIAYYLAFLLSIQSVSADFYHDRIVRGQQDIWNIKAN